MENVSWQLLQLMIPGKTNAEIFSIQNNAESVGDRPDVMILYQYD